MLLDRVMLMGAARDAAGGSKGGVRRPCCIDRPTKESQRAAKAIQWPLPSPTNWEFRHRPTSFRPSARTNVPRPSRASCFQPPSYRSPVAHTSTPPDAQKCAETTRTDADRGRRMSSGESHRRGACPRATCRRTRRRSTSSTCLGHDGLIVRGTGAKSERERGRRRAPCPCILSAFHQPSYFSSYGPVRSEGEER